MFLISLKRTPPESASERAEAVGTLLLAVVVLGMGALFYAWFVFWIAELSGRVR